MKLVKFTLTALTLTFLFTSSIYALPVAGDTATVSAGPNRSTNGGDFDITVTSANGTNTNYITFCLEEHEYLNFDATFKISSVEEYAEKGGDGFDASDGKSDAEKDYISEKTKWVYWNYLYGDLNSAYTSYDTTKSALSAKALSEAVQHTIWQLENEITSYDNTDFFKMVDSQTNLTIAGKVMVMNLEWSDGTPAQSQLVADPVPEPTTMILFGTGIAALAGASRRKMRK